MRPEWHKTDCCRQGSPLGGYPLLLSNLCKTAVGCFSTEVLH